MYSAFSNKERACCVMKLSMRPAIGFVFPHIIGIIQWYYDASIPLSYGMSISLRYLRYLNTV